MNGHEGFLAAPDRDRETLRAKGFRVTETLAGIPTAVMGEAGEGGPIIAILGEYDALPGLSQVAGIAEPRPVTPGGNGHGCGHNLLGTAGMLAVAALKDTLSATGTPATIRYFGCPGEEGGSGSQFAGSDWIGLRISDSGIVRGVRISPLFIGLLGLAVLFGALVAGWLGESGRRLRRQG